MSSESSNFSIRNILVAILITIGMVLSFFYLERAFQRGDTRRSIKAVQQSRIQPKGPTVLEGLLKEYGKNAEITWIARMEDNIRGLVIVAATLPDQTVRRWQVDVLRGTVKPVSTGLNGGPQS